MCAITGILNLEGRPASHEVITRMTAVLAHRGPDGDGIQLRDNVAFGHRRLSIIDRAGGRQPMMNEDGQVWVTFNGEIYNYRELAANLKSRGHTFKTKSDTEVIVHAWEEWGEGCLNRFRGMFAFAIADWRSGKLFIARDHFGIKPLYFIQTPQAFAFASEIQALQLVPGFNGELDLTAMDQYLWLQYIPAPRTIFQQIQKLPPAHCLTVNFSGQTTAPREYWRIAFEPREGNTESEWIEAVDAVVADSVKSHLVSDVPFGAFLSGGVDSSLVVANMSRMLGRPVETFSIGFEDKDFDETHHAAFASKITGSNHHVEIIKADALKILPELVKHYGEPFGDSSAIPTYFVSRLARRHVPMVLSGDGADEMFGGYWSHGDWLTAWADKKGVMPELADWLKFINYTATPQRLALWRPEFQGKCPAPLEGFSQEWQRAKNFSLANKVQYLDLKTYLPFDILTKVDIASMMHGLEVRTPLVDLRVIELAATIPDRFNLKRGQDGKWERKQLLKQVAANYFPAEFLHRPKMGFAIPIAKWFAPGGQLHGEISRQLLGNDSTLAQFFQPAAIKNFLDQGAFGPVWLLTFLQEWLRQNKPAAAVERLPQAIEASAASQSSPAFVSPETITSNIPMPPESKPVQSAPAKPRVRLIADVPNWIFERHARTLHALLADEFDFTLGYQGKAFDEDDFDLVYPLEFNLIDAARIRDPRKYVTGIRSHLSWQSLDFLTVTQSLAKKFSAVHVVSERLHKIFESFVPRIELISHGVDTGFFTPITRADQSGKKLRLGWAGNRLSGSKKGFAEIIEPLGQLPGVELVFCGYNDRNLSLEQMKDFYDSLDAYVCASDFEGNNNSLMEAASMQRAIITTDAGAVPEYLKDGESAFIVKRDLPDFVRAVTQLRDDPALRLRLGAAAREAVQRHFDWQQMGENYRKFFRNALNRRQNPGSTSPAIKPLGVSAKSREAGYSFCIITNGKRPQKLAEEIASIRALKIPVYEILVGGDVPAELLDATVVSLPEAAQNGQLGEMRNRLIERSRYDHLVIADDDLLFQPDFYQGLQQYGEDYEVLCVRFLNADGTRYWDWATCGGPRGHSLLDYDETDLHVYVTGGLCIMKATVPERVQWDGVRGFYQGEDLDFSRRLHQAGISIKFNRMSTVVHTDTRYTQVENRIMSLPQVAETVIAKAVEGKLDVARALHQRLAVLDPGVAAMVEKKIPATPSKIEVTLPVRWRGPIFNPSGYASEAINYILPLSEQVQLGILHQNNNYSQKFVAGLAAADRERLFALLENYPRISGGIVIDHNPAPGFSQVNDAVYRIGRTMFETDRIAPDWVTACNQMDEIWVPSRFNVETFANSGVERDKLIVMPEAVDENEFNPERHSALPLPNRAAFNFLAIFEWSRRKGWDALLSAYLREFSAEDDVCLYLRTYLFNKPEGDLGDVIRRLVREHAESLNLGKKPLPRIHVIAEQIAQADLPRLYQAVDCLVAPSRGEGWGRPHHEAMLMGLPVIATNWSGNTEFMTPENSYLIDYELTDTTSLEPELRHYRGQRWAEPSVPSLRQAMRRVQQNRSEARVKGHRARFDMLRKYSRPPVTDLLVKRLHEIERKLVTAVCPAVTARSLTMAENKSASKLKPLRVSWEGSFLDLGSLSHVNRELTQSISRVAPFQITRVGQNALPANLADQPEFKNLARKLEAKAPPKLDVTVRHGWPPNWERPATGAWVMIQPWEFGVLPAEWVSELAAVDEIWAPSDYVRRVYVESGIHPAKVKIVPNGIDPKKFQPGLKPLPLATQKKFKFLFVGGTIHRKGPDILLAAYLQTFTAADDVCLVIKDFGGNSVYQGQTLEKQIAQARLKPDAPEILYLTEELPPEAMPALYTACQCLIHPYRGEGFALPVLEAMACGLPVVVTGGGATDDFATDEFAYRLPALKKSIGETVSDLKLKRNGWWLEPQMDSLAEKMRWIANHPDEASFKGRAASKHVRQNWTWEHAAQIAAERLQAVVLSKQAGQAAIVARRARQTAPIQLPATACLGQLHEASDLLARKNFAGAWKATLAAISIRPFHCEAYLLLAEIAQSVGDANSARLCAEHAHQLAPEWKPARKFLRGDFKGDVKPQWVVLPDAITNEKSKATPRLSVCLITKNEQKFIGQCLASVKGLASQIVVLDTGSTDRTKEIALEQGAEVFSAEWRNDFSAARNAALEHATGDWILFLDADEELVAEHRETIQCEMSAAEVIGYRLPIVDSGREEEGCSYVPRLFRNAPGLFFVGRVHEQIFSSLLVRANEWNLKVELGKSALLHHGYTKEMVVSRDKIARNLKLLELAVEEMPNEPNLLMNLGLELERSGRLEEALDHSLEAFHILSQQPAAQLSPELRESLLTQISSQLIAARGFKELVKFWQTSATKAVSPTASQHFLLGLAYLELNQPAGVAEQMRLCLAKRGQPVLSPVKREILKGGPSHCLAMALSAMNDFKGADAAFRAALADEPGSRLVRFDLAKFNFQQGRAVEALQLVNALVAENPDDFATWHLGGRIALSRPEFLEFAGNWTAVAIKHFPDQSPLILQRAEVLLLSQPAESALPLWRKAHSPNAPAHLAALTICEVLAGGTPQTFHDATEMAVSQEFLKWYRQLLNYRANATVTRINERLPQFEQVVPSAARVLQKAVAQAAKSVTVVGGLAARV